MLFSRLFAQGRDPAILAMLMKPPIAAVFSIVVLVLGGCASPTAKEMRTGRSTLKRAWQDAEEGNWEVCAMNLAATMQHIREGVKLQPMWPTKAGEADLRPYLKAFEVGPWPKLEAAVRQRDLAALKPAYIEAANTCYACHTAVGRKVCLRLPDAIAAQ